jgi:hypothetical protein
MLISALQPSSRDTAVTSTSPRLWSTVRTLIESMSVLLKMRVRFALLKYTTEFIGATGPTWNFPDL